MHSLLILTINNFSRKKFLFRSEGPKISRIFWFGPKFTNQQMNKLKRALLNVMAGEAVKFVHLLWKGGHFGILITRDLLQSPLVLIFATQKMWSSCCNVIAATKNMWAALKPNFANNSMYTSHTFVLILTYARKHNEGSLGRGKTVPQAGFFGHFFSEGHQGVFSVSIKIIDGASDVYSLRRKELFWQYKLGIFAPKGLNERAADIELDMFACGTA